MKFVADWEIFVSDDFASLTEEYSSPTNPPVVELPKISGNIEVILPVEFYALKGVL